MTTIYQPPMYDRLEQITPWNGGMLAGSDVVTLADAARFASKHAKTEITPADFLRAAGRGQIPMRAISPRAATMEPCRENDKPLTMPENSIPTLPLDACKSLSNTGRAAWRTIDCFEPADSFAGALCRFTRWKLPDTEPDIVTTPDDCRLTGWDVHKLADAFIEATAQNTATPAPVVAGNEPVKQVNAMKKSALIAALEYEWPSIEDDISEATRNGLKAAAHTGKHGKWDKDKARAWAVSNGKVKQSAPIHPLTGAWPGTTTRHKITG